MRRLLIAATAIALVAAACGSGQQADESSIPELPTVSTAQVEELLATTADPVVLNVWASWCTPCRSEAPLLDRAADEFEGSVTFVGLNVRDGMDDARGFIAEFFPEAAITHLYDRPGSVPVELGGTLGVPQTFFYASNGELIARHGGVIDERTLALQIDEIIARSG